MRAAILFLLLAGCSTVAARRDEPPLLVTETAKALADFQGCFAERTANQEVQFLPRTNGATFSAGVSQGVAGRFVTWLVDIGDLGTARRITVHAINSATGRKMAIPHVEACL